MNKKLLQFALAGLCFITTPFLAMAGLTNADVIKMVKAGLSNDVIITTIRSSSDHAFDKSVDGLIALKEAKVSDAIISAIVNGPEVAVPASKIASAQTSGNGPAAATAAKDQQIGTESLILVDEKGESVLFFRVSETRTQARGMGFGGVADYSVLRGPKSELRLKDKAPRFIMAVPQNASVSTYVTLASFQVRKNGNRECMIGGGGAMGSSIEFGVHKDRVVAVNVEKLADQSRAKEGCILYSVTPKSPLASGEYAFVITSGAMPSSGMGLGQLNAYGNAFCCDFGID